MPPFVQFVIRRFLVIPVSLLIITLVLYGGVMLTPPEARATLYYPPRMNPNITEERLLQFQEAIIQQHHLRDPFLVQYAYWIASLFDGTWGYSPTMHEFVLPALLKGTPITLELGLYSLLFLIPLGLAGGVMAGWKRSGTFDRLFRGMAFVSTLRLGMCPGDSVRTQIKCIKTRVGGCRALLPHTSRLWNPKSPQLFWARCRFTRG